MKVQIKKCPISDVDIGHFISLKISLEEKVTIINYLSVNI